MTLTRKTSLRAKTPLKRTPMKQGRKKPQSAKQKEIRFRSRQYLDWVKQQRCCNCQAPADDPHHIIGLGWGLSGMGLTAPDNYAIPLCRPCHDTVHTDPAMQWMQPIWLMDTINAGLDQFPSGAIHDALQEALEFVREKAA